MDFEGNFTVKRNRQHELFASSDYTLLYLDSSGFVISYNGDVDHFLPIGVSDVLGISFLKLIGINSPSDEMQENIVKELILNGRSTLQIQLNEKKEGVSSFSADIVSLRDRANIVSGFVMVIMPSQKNEDNQVVDMISEIKDYAIFRLDSEGNVKNWNRGAERIKGYRAEEIVGSNFSIFYTPEDRDAGLPFSLLESAKKFGSANTIGWRLRKDGRKFWGNVTITAIHDMDGEVIGFSKVTHDLTEERNAELAMKELHRQLLTKTRDVEQFTFAASHDLLSPANSIISVASLLRETLGKKIDNEDLFYFQAIENSAGRIIQMLKSLLDHLKLDGKSTKQPCNLEEIVEYVKMDLRVEILDTKAIIKYDSLPIVLGHTTFLYQLFQNLLSNAIKFRKPDGIPEVHIRSIEKDDCWLLSVSDNGIGIANKDLEKIFILFQRLHSEDSYPGSGIGLTTCRKIVSLHGGEVWIESKPHHGTTVFFTLSL
ncbi:sensor histidine kinase [Sphingobacterium corticibacter]|uniref:histidine kinase n=1 Tax=Sphingobacterium corticibacter TaxID=2171749 RepID=A0A2T8HIT8_9SPHI|nr:ATP-binding protein [Sphingobacterium corticibacter]PVH25325.1 PAS domain-containing sensor histidine kinase [Sphingobacterium corticibacter]